MADSMGVPSPGVPIASLTDEAKLSTIYMSFEAVLNAVQKTSHDTLMAALKQLLDYPDIKAHIKDGIAVYLYTAAFLSLSCREIDHDNMASVIRVLGITPREDLIDIVLKANVKSHLIYVYSIYFLMANGNNISKDGIKQVIRNLSLPVDDERVDGVAKLFGIK